MNESVKMDRQVQAAPGADAAPKQIDTRTLFGGKNELLIVHAGQHYRLRITRQNKLILTK